MDDPFDLQRFVKAQDPVYAQVLAELRAGRKTSHWMWFVFPQIAGLGSSPTARRYAISGCDEARAYAGHPVLGRRLQECTAIVNELQGRTAREVFGSPDDLKFRSCMTLFSLCLDDASPFLRALTTYYAGEPDSLTEERLRRP